MSLGATPIVDPVPESREIFLKEEETPRKIDVSRVPVIR
jgi:hypothetical protein